MGNSTFDDSTIMINGRGFLHIENCRSILSYSDSEIRVQAKKYQISIGGNKLRIHYYDKDEMEVCGQIETVILKQGGM